MLAILSRPQHLYAVRRCTSISGYGDVLPWARTISDITLTLFISVNSLMPSDAYVRQ